MDRLLAIAFDPQGADQIAGFAQDLGLPFDLLMIVGEAPLDLGAEKILVADLQEVPPADCAARGIAEKARGYSHVAAVSSMRSKDVLARAAALLGASMVTDAVGLMGPRTFKRPLVAGSILAVVEVLVDPVVLTIRPAGFSKAQRAGSSTVEQVDFPVASKVRLLSKSSRGSGRPDLSQAKVIVSGGRPLKDAGTFENVIGGLADVLGGAVGATRAAVDSGIAPNELQVGQTGKIVAPEIYIAAGISGSTQHMAGIKDSKTIVAINKDPDAPIFEVADLGIVGDLFEVIPELKRRFVSGNQ
jgi:electron transfer flavoprotein alpha subunit